MATGSQRAARSRAGAPGQKAASLGCYCGQSERQEPSKRGSRGYDAGKRVKGRKRHALVDTLGFFLAVVVHGANIQDRDGAKLLLGLAKAAPVTSDLQKVWADGGYRGQLILWAKENCGWNLEVVEKSPDAKGFEVVPKRWIVERTFAWQNGSRRLSLDYEENTDSSTAWLYLAQIRFLLRRLAP